MRLTVGPLAPTVYWRRRAVVLGGLLCLLLLVSYACSGSPTPKSNQSKTGAAVTGSPSASVEPSATPAALTPIVDGTASPSASPSAAAAAQTGPCTDAEMTITPVPEVTSARRGASVKFTLKIRNSSARSCARDVGADMQELYLQQGGVKVWSSDACDARHGNDVLTFGPGREAAYYVIWDGKATAQGCANRPAPPAGTYQLVGRLGTRVSEPVNVTLAG